MCENSSARRARRNISKKLRIMKSNDAARAMFGTLFENYIFYILPMYEFLHSQGQNRTKRHLGAMSALPLKADIEAPLPYLARRIPSSDYSG